MPSAGMRALVPPIIGNPSPHGLLGGCIEVVTTTDLHQLNGTDMVSASCAQAHPWQECPTTNPGEFPWTNPPAKIFDRADWCTFEPFTAYAGVICGTFGMSYEDARVHALAQLNMGEQRALEDWFMRRWLANAAHTVDLSPPAGETALHFANGVGLLEQWLATEYGGQGILHVPAGAAALMSLHGLAEFNDGCPQTLMGNGVVLGAGYSANVGPAGTADVPLPPTTAPAGQAWLYITPPMRIRRDTPQLVQQNEGQGINTLINDRQELAESTFVAEVACCKAAAVLVSLSACC